MMERAKDTFRVWRTVRKKPCRNELDLAAFEEMWANARLAPRKFVSPNFFPQRICALRQQKRGHAASRAREVPAPPMFPPPRLPI
jgi:hypothetical protein